MHPRKAPQIVLEEVSEYRGFSVEQIISKDRIASLVAARSEVCWLLYKLTNLSQTKIGEVVGGRDHTTALNSFNRVERAMSRSGTYAAEVAELRLLTELSLRAYASFSTDRPCDCAEANALASSILRQDANATPLRAIELRPLAAAYINAMAKLSAYRSFSERLQVSLSKLP